MNKDILNEKYKIIKILGSGGTSTVYLCKDLKTEIEYAVKIMKYAHNTNNLEQEWHILKCLNHKGIPKANEFFIEDNNLHLVEEFVKGVTLQQLVEKEGILKTDRIYNIILQLCNIVSYLHSFTPPIIYRDMKPSNIMITNDDIVMLLDFGISRLYKEDKTTDTVFMGSRGYAAPEQYGLTQSQKETDIYGIGAVLFFLVTGNAPKNIMEPLEDSNYSSETPKNIIAIIKKSMQIDIKDRYSNVEEIKKEILFNLNESVEKNHEATMLFNTDDATRIIKEPRTSHTASAPKVKNTLRKRLGLLIGVSLFTALILFGVFTYYGKKNNTDGNNQKVIVPSPVSSPSTTQTPVITPKPTATPIAKEQVAKKDEFIEGVLIKSKPSRVVELGGDNEDDSKEKNKKKDDDGKEKVVIYNLSTPAEVIKNENFKIRLHTLAIREDNVVIYCDIENGTTKSLPFSYKEMYLYLNNGDKLQPIISQSEELPLIKNNSKITNISIYFKKFDLEPGKIILKTNINFDDKNYNNETNLIINVK